MVILTIFGRRCMPQIWKTFNCQFLPTSNQQFFLKSFCVTSEGGENELVFETELVEDGQ